MIGRPIRVLHVIDGLAGGGTERWVYDIVRLTQADAIEHRVVPVFPDLGDFVYATRLSALGAYHARAAGGIATRSLDAKVRHLADSEQALLLRRSLALLLRIVRPASAVWRATKELIGFRPDVIHGHSFQGLVVALVVSRLSGRPLVHTVPALFAQMHDAGFGWMPRLYGRARTIECFFSGASLAELGCVGVARERVVWIEGVVDLESADRERARRPEHQRGVRAALGIPSDARIALSVGRLHRSKGYAFALDALPSILEREPALHWIVVGEGEERERLEQRTRQAGITAHVHFVGFRPDPLPFYAAADLYLRPHVIEGENLSSFTAMAFGLPVAGFDTGAENELVRKVGHGVLAPNHDVAALAAAVSTLLAEKDRATALGAQGAAYAAEHLDIRAAIDQFVGTYRRLADARELRQNESSPRPADGEERTS